MAESHHFPWLDHHPPPFCHHSQSMAAMRTKASGSTLLEQKSPKARRKRIAVVHCKAGMGRRTVATAYLISEEVVGRERMLKDSTLTSHAHRFWPGREHTKSISRWADYVDRWTNSLGKRNTLSGRFRSLRCTFGIAEMESYRRKSYVEEGKRYQDIPHLRSR